MSALAVLLAGLFVKDPGPARPRPAVSCAPWRGPSHWPDPDELGPSRARARDYRRSVLEGGHNARVIGDGTGVSDTPHEATGGHDDFEEVATSERNWVGIGAATLAVVLSAVALLGLRHLLGVPALAGGNLLPASQGFSTLVAKTASGWAHAGAGAPGYDGPFGWLLVLFGLTTTPQHTCWRPVQTRCMPAC